MNDKQQNLKFVLYSSAFNSTLQSAVFFSLLNWNNISDNVHVSTTYYTPETLNKNYEKIKGADLGESIFGVTYAFDSNGNIINNSDSGSNSDWYRVEIFVNNKETNGLTIFDLSSTSYCTPNQLAKKVIVHEVGHTLKLKHPAYNISLAYHDYNYSGYPLSVMNQGVPNSSNSRISKTIATHDSYELMYKWD